MPASRTGFGSMLAALIVVALATGCAFGGTISEVAVVPRRRGAGTDCLRWPRGPRAR